jgi:two-component system response regulator AtoC
MPHALEEPKLVLERSDGGPVSFSEDFYGDAQAELMVKRFVHGPRSSPAEEAQKLQASGPREISFGCHFFHVARRGRLRYSNKVERRRGAEGAVTRGSDEAGEASTLGQSATTGPERTELVVVEPRGLAFYTLPESGALRIGRGEDCEIRLSDPLASREHATLELAPLGIRDEGSANGTRLGSEELEAGAVVPLAAGQSLHIGNTLLVLRRRAARLSAVPAPARLDSTLRPRARTRPQVVLDPAMCELYGTVERLARGSINVLITGETGAGKELVAEMVHQGSARADAPLVRLNCAALAESLLESELFGHERGAFTGAVAAKPGLVELADGGTFFLDEVGELTPALQAKLLRVVEAGELTRVGGSRPRPVDVRFVAATNRDLDAAVAAGTFRADLLFRLSGAAVVVPPLRARQSEILPLAELFLARAAAELGACVLPVLSAEARARLLAHDFPGNVRELKNAIERGVLLCEHGVLTPADLALEPRDRSTGAAEAAPGEELPISELSRLSPSAEKERILHALVKHGGNQTRVARELGVSRRTLVRRIAELGLPRPRDRAG